MLPQRHVDPTGRPRAAVLLSGGMDSIGVAAWCRPRVAITIDYGQVAAEAEVRAAAAVAEMLAMPHEVFRVDCRGLGLGDLAGRAPALPAAVSEWWPFRNQLLLTLAGMRAVMLGIDTLLIGTVAGDRVRCADGRPEFVDALSRCMALQEGGIRVEAPAIGLTSAELLRASGAPRAVIAWAHSCHVSNVACGDCRGCRKHQEVTAELWGVDAAY